MKIFRLTFLFVVGMLFAALPAHAIINPIAPTAVVSQEQKMAQKEVKKAKRFANAKAIAAKAGVDFQDPVQKWFWFWIFGWGGAILFAILGAILSVVLGPLGLLISILGSILGVFGTISLIIWLLKKFGGL